MLSRQTAKKTEIRQAKALTRASYALERNEKRLVYMAINHAIDSGLTDEDFAALPFGNFPVVIKNSEYAELFECSRNNEGKEIAKASESIFKKSVVFYLPEHDSGTEKALDRIQWVNEKSIRPVRGETTLFFNAKLMSIITKVNPSFTKFLISDAGNLKSAHSQRLFESLSDWVARKKSVTFTLDWMFERYLLPDSYRRMSDFRRRFLNPAIAEINEKTSFVNLRATEIKEGKIMKILFEWDKEPEQAKTTDPKQNNVIEPIQTETQLELAAWTYAAISNDDLHVVTKSGLDALTACTMQLMMDGFSFDAEMMSKIKRLKESV